MDLNAMIDSIMEQVKGGDIFQQAEEKKRRSDLLYEQHRATEQANQFATAKDIRAHDNDLVKQNLTETGLLARQNLANDSAANVAQIGANQHRDVAASALEGEKYKADRLYAGTTGKAGSHEAVITAAIKGNPLMTSDQIIDLRQKLMDQNQGNSGATVRSFDKPGPAITPAGPGDPIGPTATLATPGVLPAARSTLTGGQSMEFRSGPQPMTQDEEEDKYLGMLPGVRKKQRANIFGF